MRHSEDVITITRPMLSEIVQNEIERGEKFEGMTLRITAIPYLCIVLTLAPIVLDIIFERKKKK